MPEGQSEQNINSRLLQELVLVQLQHFVNKSNIQIITREMIPLFDTKPEEPRNTNSAQINKIVFVHLMPL